MLEIIKYDISHSSPPTSTEMFGEVRHGFGSYFRGKIEDKDYLTYLILVVTCQWFPPTHNRGVCCLSRGVACHFYSLSKDFIFSR